MLATLAPAPEPVTLPLLSDPSNVQALYAHYVETMAEKEPDDRLTAALRILSGTLGSAEGQAALLAALAFMSPGAEAATRMTNPALAAATALEAARVVYGHQADPDAFDIELPGLHVTLRGVTDYRDIERAAERAVRRNGKRWRQPALGQSIAARVDVLTREAQRRGEMDGRATDIRARELDRLTDAEHDAYGEYQQWAVAYAREVARRMVVEVHGLDAYGVPVEMRTADAGGLWDPDALCSTGWVVPTSQTETTVEGKRLRFSADQVDNLCSEVMNLSRLVYSAGKGPRSQRASAYGKPAATEASAGPAGPATSAEPTPS